MSELDDQRWAVISERGVEASHLTHADAVDLSRTLTTVTKATGATVTTNDAARREGNARQAAVIGNAI